MKSVRIRSYSGPYLDAFGQNTDRYRLALRIQSECGKIRTRITANTDILHAVKHSKETLSETFPKLLLKNDLTLKSKWRKWASIVGYTLALAYSSKGWLDFKKSHIFLKHDPALGTGHKILIQSGLIWWCFAHMQVNKLIVTDYI